MIEPEVTAVLGRRLLAFLIDSSLVAATGLGVAFQQSTAIIFAKQLLHRPIRINVKLVPKLHHTNR